MQSIFRRIIMKSVQDTRLFTLIASDSTNHSLIILFSFSRFCSNQIGIVSTSPFYVYIIHSYRRRVVNKICSWFTTFNNILNVYLQLCQWHTIVFYLTHVTREHVFLLVFLNLSSARFKLIQL